jgi:hypothetical protein
MIGPSPFSPGRQKLFSLRVYERAVKVLTGPFVFPLSSKTVFTLHERTFKSRKIGPSLGFCFPRVIKNCFHTSLGSDGQPWVGRILSLFG